MKVLVLEKNLILLSRIKNVLKAFQVSTNREYTDEDVVLINLEANPVSMVKDLKDKGAKVIGYCGHKNVELIEKAKSYGADLVVSNSQIIHADQILKSVKFEY